MVKLSLSLFQHPSQAFSHCYLRATRMCILLLIALLTSRILCMAFGLPGGFNFNIKSLGLAAARSVATGEIATRIEATADFVARSRTKSYAERARIPGGVMLPAPAKCFNAASAVVACGVQFLPRTHRKTLDRMGSNVVQNVNVLAYRRIQSKPNRPKPGNV